MAESALLEVDAVYVDAQGRVHERTLSVPPGTTVAAVVLSCAWLAEDEAPAGVGVWGRKVGPSRLVRHGDRVEIYRPLLVDPKVARRERFQKQGTRTSGLFAQRRPGAKAGY